MPNRSRRLLAGLLVTVIVGLSALVIAPERFFSESPFGYGDSRPDVHFVPTARPAVAEMLELAQVTEDDVIYDLGCGDGRIVLTAAQRYGARGVGIDIDPELIARCRREARRLGVEHLVRFEQKNLFDVDLEEATVVTLFLLPTMNVRLIPQLDQLAPGARVVSNMFIIDGYQPDQVRETVSSLPGASEKSMLYLYRMPLQSHGSIDERSNPSLKSPPK